MVYADILSQMHSAISSKKANINEKIDRLVKAKNEIMEEQSMCLNEIRNIKTPELGKNWTGSARINFKKPVRTLIR